MKRTIFQLCVLFFLIIFLNGCAPGVMVAVPGSPPHGNAYGHAKHTYRYYPDLEVYWDGEAKMYVAFQNREWVTVRSYPQVRWEAYIVIETETPKPWQNHDAVKKQYPPGNNRNKNKGG